MDPDGEENTAVFMIHMRTVDYTADITKTLTELAFEEHGRSPKGGKESKSTSALAEDNQREKRRWR